MESLLGSLINIKSISGNEDKIQKYILSWFDENGIKSYSQDGNSIGYIKGLNSSKCLILSGHSDTVSIGDEKLWNTDPLVAVKNDDKIFGLGSSDMKAGIAVILEIAKNYKNKKPPIDLWFTFVINEEIDGAGSNSFVRWFQGIPEYNNYKDISAIICEPTNSNIVEFGHRGNYFIEIDIISISGHASKPNSIKNKAIDLTILLISELEILQEKWIIKYNNSDLGYPTIAITGLWAGDINSPNKIAGKSSLQIDIRTTPEMHYQVENELLELCSKISTETKVNVKSTTPFGWTEKDSKIRTLFANLFPKFSQKAMIGSSDLCLFTEAGIPTVIFGPGEKKAMHMPNEYVLINKLDSAYKTLIMVVENYGK